MGIYSAILTFVVIWWLVLFTVLPWGVRRAEHTEVGHEPGAPDSPRLWHKVAITTLIAIMVFALVRWMIISEVISFRVPGN